MMASNRALKNKKSKAGSCGESILHLLVDKRTEEHSGNPDEPKLVLQQGWSAPANLSHQLRGFE
jgi:hypothetical protein